MATYEPFYSRSMELPDQLLVGAIDSHVHAGPVLRSNPGHLDPIQVARGPRGGHAGHRLLRRVRLGLGHRVDGQPPCDGLDTFGGYLMNSCHGGMNPRAVLTALHLGGGCRLSASARTARYFQATTESTLVDGKLVPFKDAYPRFAEQELSRATRIPLEDPVPPDALTKSSTMVAEHPEVYLNTGHVSARGDARARPGRAVRHQQGAGRAPGAGAAYCRAAEGGRPAGRLPRGLRSSTGCPVDAADALLRRARV